MRSFNPMKRYSLLGALSLAMVLIVMAFIRKGTAFPDKHLEIVLRNIGHEVLLHSNDSTSRVLPIEAVDDNTFRISFENGFNFTPDTLMTLVHQQLAKTDRPGIYTVSVLDCSTGKTVFAYEVNTAQGDLKPCRKREQSKGCYVIEIAFPSKKSIPYGWILLGLVPLALAGFHYARKQNVSPVSPAPAEEEVSGSRSSETGSTRDTAELERIGDFMFDASKGILSLNGEHTELSLKETKALRLLASNPNQVVERGRLMKEIWEDEGVYVIDRNVDVLMSKLRKRLSGDPSLKIVNVHGKGYKLVV